MSNTENARADGEMPVSTDEILLAELLDVVLGKFERGEAVDVEALLPGKPGLLERARRVAASLEKMREAGLSLTERAGAAPPPSSTSTAPGGGSVLPDPFPGEYRFLQDVGRGTFGTVYLAEDLNLPWQVAFKTVRVPPGSEKA
jgi:hypothetical protein